jgi:transposase
VHESETPFYIKHEGMKQMTSEVKQQQIEWRRAKVLELSSQGYSQIEIATNLQMDKSIISRDVAYLRQQAQDNLKMHPRQTSRRISKLHDWYQSGVKDMLGDCK